MENTEKYKKLKEDLRTYKTNNHFYKIRINRLEDRLKETTIDWEIREYQRELRSWQEKLRENEKDCSRLEKRIADYYFELGRVS